MPHLNEEGCPWPPSREAEAPSAGEVASLRRVIADAERGAIQALGISRAAFYQKLAQLGLG